MIDFDYPHTIIVQCPHCQSTDYHIRKYSLTYAGSASSEYWYYYIECKKCGKRGADSPGPKAATKCWERKVHA